MKIFSVKDENMDLTDFVVGRFRYDRKGIVTDAIQVTPENIAMLALEFETDLWYDNLGEPSFAFNAERLSSGSNMPPDTRGYNRLTVHPSDWLLHLREEFHLLRDYQFIHTFKAIGPVTHHPMRDHWNPDMTRTAVEVRRPFSTDPGSENFDGVAFMQEQVEKDGLHALREKLEDDTSGVLPDAFQIGQDAQVIDGEMKGKIGVVKLLDFNWITLEFQDGDVTFDQRQLASYP